MEPLTLNSSVPTILSKINEMDLFYNFKIKVCVKSKTKLITYADHKGEGVLFSFDAFDDSGEIRIVAFNNVCNKFFNLIKPNHAYHISNCLIVKSRGKKFTGLDNEYELVLKEESVI